MRSSELFEGAGFEAAVAQLQLRFVPVSARRTGPEHRGDLIEWLNSTTTTRCCSASPPGPVVSDGTEDASKRETPYGPPP